MAFSTPPDFSKNQINLAGKVLRNQKEVSEIEYRKAIQIADKWRACHAYPINTFQATLRTKLRGRENVIVAQRLKRMATIIKKLEYNHEMQLTTMQDIGGVRVVLPNIKSVYSLVNDYINNKRLLHELYNHKDYILSPRDEDGYRSIHLMYKYKNNQNVIYNGLRIELQIRTKTQHMWATAVETMGTFLDQAFKSRRGNKEWLDFFSIVSSAFASLEKTAVLPKHSKMNQMEIFQAVIDAEKKLDALNKMKGFNAAVEIITKKDKNLALTKSFYHVITLNTLEKKIQIRGFSRDQLKRALGVYATIESEIEKGKKIEVYFVSTGPLKILKQAYPNIFLDISEFCNEVSKIRNLVLNN